MRLHSPDVHLLFGPNVLCSDSTRLSFVSGIRIKVWFCDVKLNTVPNRLLSLWCFLNLLLCLHLLLLFSLFSFRLGFLKTGFLSPSRLLQKGLLTLPASWRGLSSQLSAPACLLWMLLTHRGFDDEQRAALSALLGGSRAGFHAETKTNETRSRRIVHTESMSRLLTAPKQYSVTFTSWAGVCQHLLTAVSLSLRILWDFIVNVFILHV